jgi:O-antigen/teichoic acid export membrane protein
MDEASVVRRRLRTDVFLTFGGKGTSLVLGLLIVVLLARELGPTRQGIFAVAFSLTVILIHLGGLGVTTANPYFVAREPGRQPRIAANSLWLAGSLGLVLVAIGIGLKLLLPATVEGVTWTQLLIALAGVPAALGALFLQSILLGEGRMVAYNAIEVAQFAGTLGILAVGFWAFDFGVTEALAVVTASRIAAMLAYLWAARTRPGWPNGALARRMMAYGFRAYLALLVSFLVVRVDLLLVNGYLGSNQAGLYSVAATIADGMYVLPAVVGINLFPRVAESGESQETAEVFRSVAVLYGLVCLATIPLADPAIRLFFGDAFAGSISLYYWLLPGIYCLGMLTILAHHFAGRGYPTEAAVVWLVGLAINLAINVAFLPGRGAWVASLASSIAYAVLLVLHIRLFVRETGSYGALRPRMREVVGFVRTAFARG